MTMRSIAVAVLGVWLAGQALPALCCGRVGRGLLSGDSKFNYQKAGSDWAETYPECGGSHQSPINIVTSDVKHPLNDLSARIVTFGKGHRVKVQNTGQAVGVTWNDTEVPTVLLPVVDGHVSASIDPLDPIQDHIFKKSIEGNGVQEFSFANLKLEQFHFHIGSENAIDGVLYPMEAHLVTTIPKEEVPACGDEGCIVVFAILYKISEEDNEFLQPFFESAPDAAGHEHEEEFPEYFEANFDELFPEEKSYYTWQGSFTTPPCTEDVLWILFDHFSTVSTRQLTMLESQMSAVRKTCQKQAEEEGDMHRLAECEFIGDLKNSRALQPLNDRTVKHVVFSSSEPPTTR